MKRYRVKCSTKSLTHAMGTAADANNVKTRNGKIIVKTAEKYASHLMDNARSDLDLEAAQLLRKLGRVYDVAYEMCCAKTHEHSRAAYMEMIDLMKGKHE